MTLKDMIERRDILKQEVALKNLKQLLGYLDEEDIKNLQVQKDTLRDLDREIFRIERDLN